MPEPKYLYRYQRLPDKNNPNEKDWLENLFTHNKLWFSSPSSFNDPFDCKIAFSFNGSNEEIDTLINAAIEAKNRGMELEFREHKKHNFHKDEEWQFHISKLWKEILIEESEKTGMLCLSEADDDILMWSHYTDKHKGYCLKFNAKIVSNEAQYLQSILYRENFPNILDVFNNGAKKAPARLLLYKANHWKYEKEWRWIRFPMIEEELNVDLGSKNYDYPPEMLTAVIFGCEMKDEEREELRKLVKSNPKLGHVRFHEAKKKPNEFGLDIIPLPE